MPRRKPSEVLDLISQAKRIDLEELAAEMLGAFGGPRGYANLCADEFKNTENPQVRTKLLEGVRHLVVATAAKSKAVDDVSMMSDEELKEAVYGGQEEEQQAA